VVKRRLVLLLVGVTVALAGCGGNGGNGAPARTTAAPVEKPVQLGKTAYEKTMRRIGNELGKSIDGLYPLSSGPRGSDTAKETVVKLEKARAVITGVSAQLAHIVPPPAIASEHKRLEAGVRELTAQIDKLIESDKAGDVGAFVAGSNFSSLQIIESAADAMKVKGYDILALPGAAPGK
jgi:hypothetical protein